MSKLALLCGWGVFVLVTAGCSHGGRHYDEYDYDDDAHHDNDDDRTHEGGHDRDDDDDDDDDGDRHQKWVKLGSRKVEYKTDEEYITPGKHRGRFHQIRFDVKGGDFEMYDVKVVLDDGSAVSPADRYRFEKGMRGCTIDLPGDGCDIRQVRFACRSLHEGKKATVTLYAR